MVNILVVGNSDPRQTKGPICFTSKHIKQIKKILPGARITVVADQNKNPKALSEAEIIIKTFGYPVGFKKAPNLKWVHSGSAGVSDLVEDLKNTDVLLTNSSGVAPIPISEHVAGFMLMFAKRLHVQYANQIVKKRWIRNYQEIGGFELAGSTVGIIGYGRIGSQIAQISKGLGLYVTALSHNKKISDRNVDKVYKNVDDILKNSDFVVNALPLTSATERFYDLKKFRTMRKTAYFINIGRGMSVVQKDLVKALKTGTIAGAGLDVVEVEPLSDKSELWNTPNLILTPHSSSWNPKYTDRVMDIFCNNLSSFLKGKPMSTLVDKSKGY